MRHHPVKAEISLRGLPTNASLEIILRAIFNCKHFISQLDRGIHATFLPDFFKVFFAIPAFQRHPSLAFQAPRLAARADYQAIAERDRSGLDQVAAEAIHVLTGNCQCFTNRSQSLF